VLALENVPALVALAQCHRKFKKPHMLSYRNMIHSRIHVAGF
jgi:hypothetical protein